MVAAATHLGGARAKRKHLFPPCSFVNYAVLSATNSMRSVH